MTISNLRNQLPDYAKDIKINLGNVLSAEADTTITELQIAVIALASAYSTKSAPVISALEAEYADQLTTEQITGAKTANAVMAMNNVYYRFVHLVGDSQFATMPAGLRMQSMNNSGLEKIDFELCSLAVSAINGCGMCMESHAKTLLKHEVKPQAIQSTIKIAASIKAAADVLALES